jgi:hypothetical protein
MRAERHAPVWDVGDDEEVDEDEDEDEEAVRRCMEGERTRCVDLNL